MGKYSVVGKSVPSVGSPAMVTGKIRYMTDLKQANMLYGKILKSPYAHAKIISIDTSKAEILPGVRAVVTGKDAPTERFGIYISDQLIIEPEIIRFIGQPVAAVAADTLDIAQEALKLIHVQYEEMPAVFDLEEAWSTNPPAVIHPDLPQYKLAPLNAPVLEPDRPNVTNHYRVYEGDVEEGFRQADLIIENKFSTARIQHCCLEPNICIASVDPDDVLTIQGTRQGLYGTKDLIGRAFGLPPSKVRIITSHYIGGSFGSKFMPGVDEIAGLLAYNTRRPVRIAYTREEEFTNGGTRIPAITYIKDGVKKDGTLVAREMKVIVNSGAYAWRGAVLARNSSFGAVGTYRVPNFKYDAYGVYTNEEPVIAFRGFGSEQPTWAIESQMDMIAEKLGLDPLEVRKKNFLKEGDVNNTGEIVHSIGARQCLEKVAECMKEDGYGKTQKEVNGPWKKGAGLAIGNKFSVAPAAAVGSVKVNADGTIEVRHSADNFGQGTNNVMGQIAAEEFGISLDRVKIIWGDTSITPYSQGTLSQGGTYHTGNGVRLACQDAKRKLFEVAAKKLNVPPEELTTSEGKVYVKARPSESIEIGELFTMISFYAKPGATIGTFVENVGEIIGSAVWIQKYVPPDTETGRIPLDVAKQGIRLASFFGYEACGVEVLVNLETGEVKVTKVVLAEDMGQPINPKLCEGQMEGGFVQALGSTLREEVIIDKGKVLNPNWRDYKVPTTLDVPCGENFKSFITPVPHKDGPFGAKGMGEVVMTPVAPAIANAVYNAVGVRMKHIPMTSERVLKALEEAGKA